VSNAALNVWSIPLEDSSLALQGLTRDKLYDDSDLGAGNFLFKAYEISSTPTVAFLFLEKHFITPLGDQYTEFSLKTLRAVVKGLARWYLAHGIGNGVYVCTYVDNGIAQFVHYLALNSIAAIPVLINCKMPPEVLAKYAEENGFEILVVDQTTGAAAKSCNDLCTLRHLEAQTAETANLPPLPQDWPIARVGDYTVMLCHSSGTTGIPKAVVFGHEQFFFGKRERLRRFIEEREDRMVMAMPSSHSAGISYLMTATMLELPTLVLTELTGPSAAANIVDFKATIATGFPQTWASLTEQDLPNNGLGTLRRFYNTGDAAHEAHITKLLAIAPAARFCDGFGASEMGMALFEKVSRPGAVASRRCVGRPVAFAEAIIVDPAGNRLPRGEVGYFAIKSPTITRGYHERPQLTQLCTFGQHWLTGDVGYQAEDGDFYQIDRAVDVVTTPFGPLYTLVTEELLQAMPGVHDASVIGVERSPMRVHATIALIVPVKNGLVKAAALLNKLHQLPVFDRHLPAFTLCAAVVADRHGLPTGPTGKVLKRSLRDAFWRLHSAYAAGDRGAFCDVAWNR
jgi:long-chain acyl-CoA synthetase